MLFYNHKTKLSKYNTGLLKTSKPITTSKRYMIIYDALKDIYKDADFKDKLNLLSITRGIKYHTT